MCLGLIIVIMSTGNSLFFSCGSLLFFSLEDATGFIHITTQFVSLFVRYAR